MKLALIGHGSIGSQYKSEIAKNLYEIDDFYIVDPKESVLEELKRDKYKCFSSITDLEKKNIKIDYGIVANWGPDHIETANKLIDLGCKRMIIEKPLANRKDELQLFRERCIKQNIFVTIHHHWAYTNILEKIEQAEFEFNLGDPKGIRIIGGSVCLSTNGTHFLDLSLDVLKSTPEHIMAELELDHINPRNKKLLNVGGMTAYKMKNGTFINVSFSNENSEAIRFEILYRHGLLSLGNDGKLKCFQRDMNEVKKYQDKITRYGKFYLEKEIQFEKISTVERVLSNLISNQKPIVNLKKAEVTTLMVIGAIQSHLEGQRIKYDNIEDHGLLIS